MTAAHVTDGTSEAPVLRVQDLTTEFATRGGRVRAVHGVSFAVRRGAVVGVVGESGCGKSVTTRSILRLLPHNGRVVAGSVDFAGTDLLAASPKRMRELRGESIGFVAQNPFGALNPILTVDAQFANVIRAHRRGTSAAACHAAAAAALADVGIPDPERVLRGHAHELSGGMAQRVVIALALVLDPDLLIADEPTTALDVTIQRQILDLVQRVVQADRRSMMLITHDLGVVAQYCDDVVVMYAGKVVESGRVTEVFSTPAHPYTRALLGSVPERGKSIEVLRGRVPDLRDYPAGCPFADRCAHVHARCRAEAPTLLGVGSSDGLRRVSCHLATAEVSVA